ncbi:hypothetical protein SLS62_005230 [Diatrype stigma]|uniref:Glutamine amidotransferase type-2 domain-containing protein n=1 Tax=Diatrype stigma TaxID=117547 RepID=A0AAN9V3N1_9PEZI
MCGIHAVISDGASGEPPPLSESLQQTLSSRGPDYFGQVKRDIPLDEERTKALHLVLTSTVLALRGDHVAAQPLEDTASDSVLCWNGEAWRLGNETVTGNDGEAILAKLRIAESSVVDASETREACVLNVLRSIEGPFAFLYYDAEAKRLYFGRDRLGRRSLLYNVSEDRRSITFSSIADVPASGWQEVEADGVYSIRLDALAAASGSAMGSWDLNTYITKHDWVPSAPVDMISSIGTFNTTLPGPGCVLNYDTPSVSILRHWISESLKLRVLNVPEPSDVPSDIDTRVAVLFSGGLDCTVLVRLVHEVLPSEQGIDLINVAFENPRQVAIFAKQPNPPKGGFYESCPDRITGRKSFAELKAACPGRYIRFIAVNVPFEEAMRHKTKVVSLMYPHDTEMDLSIAFALYFAARGMGDSYTTDAEWNPNPAIVTTPARVLLSGLGADELFGGYSRHEIAFKRDGYRGLIDELMLDVRRIGQRNLGRDDRVIAHWGKEVRLPFLDEQLVRYAISCPVWEKCDFQNPYHLAVIEPAKRALRLLADQLGLPSAAREKKRAVSLRYLECVSI